MRDSRAVFGRPIPRRWRPWLLFALGLALNLPLLGARDIVTSHEGRVAQTAREMAASGWPWAATPMRVPPAHLTRRADGAMRLEPASGEPPVELNPWLVPTLNGVIRLQKPPLPYWCAAILFKLSGGFSETAARLFPATFAAVGAVLLYQLARALAGEVAAWLAGLVWLSSYFVFDPYRKAMPDPYLAFFTLLAAWAWVTGSLRRTQADDGGGAIITLAFYLALGLGGLAKGPVIFLHVALALIAYHVCYRRRKLPGKWWSHVLGAALFLAMAVPWPAYVLSHVPHALDLWKYESVGELGENVEHAARWWFYFPQLFVISLPWTALWLIGIWDAFRTTSPTKRRRLLFPAIWFGATVLFFSFVNLKKDAYLLPVMPAGVLLGAQGLRAVLAGFRRGDRRAGIVLAAHAIAGAITSVALGWATLQARASTTERACGVGLAFAAILLAVGAMRLVRTRNSRPAVVCTAVAFALLLFVLSNVVITAKDNARSPRPAAQIVAKEAAAPDSAIYHRYLPSEAAVYLPVGSAEVPAANRVLLIVGDRRVGAGPLKPADFQSWFPDRPVVSVETIPLGRRDESGRWSVVEIRTAAR
jgi:4-amino-4-deoxy-L-arabinose transferase-like glycosyltransferase